MTALNGNGKFEHVLSWAFRLITVSLVTIALWVMQNIVDDIARLEKGILKVAVEVTELKITLAGKYMTEKQVEKAIQESEQRMMERIERSLR